MKGQLLYNVKGDLTFHSLPDNYAGPYRIPEGIRIIAENAFNNCEFLTSIEIPSSVTSIGDSAFEGCRGLTSIEIPSSVTSIGDGAFAWCSRLTSIVIPSSVSSIGRDAFEFTHFSQDEIKEIYSYVDEIREKSPSLSISHSTPSKEISPQSNQNILDETDSASTTSSNHIIVYMYDGSGTDKEVKIPSTYTRIGDVAFLGCSGLTSIEIPSSVTSIGYKAFQGCSGLTSIEIPSSVTSIGYKAFQGCSGLTSIEIPSSVTSIGYWAFQGCSGLTSIEIPSSVTSIGYWAFVGCSGLTSIEIPSSVTRIGDGAFDGCSGLTSIEIPSSVTSIGYKAFQRCSGLERIAILGNSTSISWPVFRGCDKLKKLKMNSSSYVVDNGLVYNQARTELFEFIPSLCAGDTIIISERVQIIHHEAFNNLSSVKSIELPKYLRSIEHNAFDLTSSEVQIIINTDNLKQIRIENKSFTNIESTCSLVVPVGTRYAYSHHPVWGKFPKITTAEIDWDDEESEQ